MPLPGAELNLACLLPEILLLAGATGTIFFSGAARRSTTALCAVAAITVSLVTTAILSGRVGVTGFGGLLFKGEVVLLYLVLVDLAAMAAVILSAGRDDEAGSGGEYFGLLLFALLGMHVMAAGRDLLVVFIGLEILALPLYVLVGFRRNAREGMEAAVKYFLLGSFSSAVFLLGLALYYGATGTTAMDALARTLPFHVPAYVGVTLVVAGIGFKLAAVPFHMWAPDAYEGAPVAVAAYISVAPKAAAFSVLLSLCMALTGPGPAIIAQAVLVMAVASMVIGNLAALKQEGFVRMLAYSGIAQAGYMLIGLPSLQAEGGAALSFYLFVYLFMNLGAFAVVVAAGREKGGLLRIDDLAGLAARRPFLAFALSVFMVSLAGLPPTGGFFAKFYIFKAGIEAGYLSVVLVAIVMSVVSLFYYLRVVMVMYMAPVPGEAPHPPTAMPVLEGFLAVMVLLVFVTGVLPGDIVGRILSLF